MNPIELCPRCQKSLQPVSLCVCQTLRKVGPLKTRHSVLILQHPQEPDKDLGSAHLAHLALPQSQLKIGLSWPNLSKALGRETQASRWAVLYLGSGLQKKPGKTLPPLSVGRADAPRLAPSPLTLVDKKGVALPNSEELLQDLEGIVVLDGTWSQAKTLWWRNAWLLKLRRAILTPSRPSLYQELRKEPRRECLSTIESTAEALSALGESDKVSEGLRTVFAGLLDQYRKSGIQPRPAQRPPRADWRRSRRPQSGPKPKV